MSTEQFNKLATAIMRSQGVPESIAIEIKGNPEFIGEAALASVADLVIDEVVRKLTQEHFTRKQ